MLRLLKALKIESTITNGGRCMKGSDGKLCFSKERGKVWRDYLKES